MKPIYLFISCEHAVNHVPPAYAHLFHKHKPILDTHQAVDFGACEIATQISQQLACDYVEAQVTRLLIDCNRSLSHPRCFSDFTKMRPSPEKQALITKYYLPFREQSETLIQTNISQGYQILHISLHTFTPSLHGKIRQTGIGILYDPSRHGEKEVARQWKAILAQQTPQYKTRMNYPYQGVSNGFTSNLREKHPEKDYLGFELEINQTLTQHETTLNLVKTALIQSLRDLLELLS